MALAMEMAGKICPPVPPPLMISLTPDPSPVGRGVELLLVV